MAKPRAMQNVHDMVLSMGVVLVAVALLLAVTYRSHKQVEYSVDYQGTLATAAAAGDFRMVVPNPLPAGLTPTVARYEPETYGTQGSMRLYLGYKTAGGDFVSVWQSNGGVGKVVANATNGGVCEQSMPADGWMKCVQSKPLTNSFVKTGKYSVIVVSGTADWKTLQAVRDSLVVLHK